MKGSPLRVLYITYWGASEPLGQSLILPAVKKIAVTGVQMVLITFEKPADLADREGMAKIRMSLAESGITWIPLQYHKRPKVPATAFDLAQGIVRSLTVTLGFSFDIVHARTYVAGLMGLAIARLLGIKFIYHNEGFYPDEQVDGGVWKKEISATPHCQISGTAHVRRRWSRIITLSQRARGVVESIPAVGGLNPRALSLSSPVALILTNFTADRTTHTRGLWISCISAALAIAIFLLALLGSWPWPVVNWAAADCACSPGRNQEWSNPRLPTLAFLRERGRWRPYRTRVCLRN